MGAGDRDLKRKEASMSKTESGDDNLKKIQVQAMALLATKPALAGARKKRKKLVKTRLPQELVDEIMRRPVTHFPVIPDELVAGFSEECRAAFAMQKAEELTPTSSGSTKTTATRRWKRRSLTMSRGRWRTREDEEITDNAEETLDHDHLLNFRCNSVVQFCLDIFLEI
jgi:hypothetical protein